MTSIREINVNVALAALLTLTMTAGVDVALAQERLNIATVNIQFLMENSDAAKDLRKQTDKIRAEYQREINNKQNEIDKISQGIEQQRPTISVEAYQRRMRELRRTIANHESDLQERQSELDAAFSGESQKIAVAIEQVVDEIRKEQNFVLVLPRSVIIGTTDVPEITQEVLKRLNQQMPLVIIDSL